MGEREAEGSEVMARVRGKRTADLPAAMGPYIFHGLDISWKRDAKDAAADCPFCGGERKLILVAADGRWRCLRCNTGEDNGKAFKGGNATTFLRLLWERGCAITTSEDLAGLAKQRGILSPLTIARWGLCRSPLTGEWLVPGWSMQGKLCQLYRWVRIGERSELRATTGIEHYLHGLNLWEPKKGTAWIMEGVWDAMAVWELLPGIKGPMGGGGDAGSNGHGPTLATDINVVAVPGAGVFKEGWCQLFKGKRVRMFYDSDHPRVNCAKCKVPYSVAAHDLCPICRGKDRMGGVLPPVGWDAARRVTGMLMGGAEKPAQVQVLRWGEEGFDPSKKSGWDVRDVVTAATDRAGRARAVVSLTTRLTPPPAEWVGGGGAGKGVQDDSSDCLPCSSWADLRLAWQKAFVWTTGLDTTLAVMLSSVASTMSVGDQLWLEVLSPASTGKTALAEALGVNKQYVFCTSVFTGFHSGWKTDARGKTDHGLLEKVKGKTLVIKEGDTLLRNPARDQILSEMRDVYDKVSRVHYKHGVSRSHEGVPMTFILCGTGGLKELDSAELGARFLVCELMGEIDEGLEEDIMRRAMHRTIRNMSTQANGKLESQYSPEQVLAMQKTGGYVSWLRENAQRKMDKMAFPGESFDKCRNLALLVAFMRARQSKKQEESVEREMGTRLGCQLVRLAMCLAVVMNRRSVDADVMGRVQKVAIDTASGHTLRMAGHLINAGHKGMGTDSLANRMGETVQSLVSKLHFLLKIKVVERFRERTAPGVSGDLRWRLTERVARLYASAMSEHGGTA